MEVAVGPAQLVTSAYWTLRGASAFVAGKLGTTVTHVLQQHSMLHMTKVCKLKPSRHQTFCSVGGLASTNRHLKFEQTAMRSLFYNFQPLFCLRGRLSVVTFVHDTVSCNI